MNSCQVVASLNVWSDTADSNGGHALCRHEAIEYQWATRKFIGEGMWSYSQAYMLLGNQVYYAACAFGLAAIWSRAITRLIFITLM